jgi:predicted phage terminase large subunit-like protein
MPQSNTLIQELREEVGSVDLGSLGNLFSNEDLNDVVGSFREQLCPPTTEVSDSVLDWGKRFLPHYYDRAPSRMHRSVSETISCMHSARGTRRVIIAPRGSAKSTFVSLTYVLKCICEHVETYIFLTSDTADQSYTFLEAIKNELETNSALADAYPGACGIGSIWRTNRIVARNGVAVDALGTGNKIRGRRRKQHRPSLIVADDLENDDHIFSPRQRERARSWFNRALMKCGNKDTNVLVLGTVLHRECLPLTLARTPGWAHDLFQAIEQWPKHMELWAQWETIYTDIQNPRYQDEAREFYERNKQQMDEGAVLLWPEQESLYELMQMRVREGRNAFESEKQGNPVNPEACEFPSEWLDDDRIWFEQWPDAKTLTLKVMALDPSKGRDARRGDYSAIVKLARARDGILYVEADLERRDVAKIVDDGIDVYRRFPGCQGFAIETNQFQELLAGDFLRESQLQGIMLPIYEIVNVVRKEVRIRRLGPYLSRRLFRFKTRSPGTLMLVNQMRDLFTGDHDDGPDALEMALRLAIELDNDVALAGAA